MATNEPGHPSRWVAGIEGSEDDPRPERPPPGHPDPGGADPVRARVEIATEAAQPSDPTSQLVAAGITRLRDEAANAAQRDADAGLPDENTEGQTEREHDLRERCRAFYDRWSHQYRR